MYLSELAQSLTPYTAGEQPKDQVYIKLNTNENPYPPSPKALKSVEIAKQDLRLYPDTDATLLRYAIAEVNGVSADNVFCGNGSDEVLAFAFAAFFAGKKLIAPDITYSFYPSYAKMYAVDYETCPLTADFSLNVDGMLKGACIALANPNAPTGRMLAIDEIARMAAHAQENGCVMLVDEAYAAFAGDNAVKLLDEFDNLLIIRTFSKSHSLAGMRVGYALGSVALMDALRRVRDSFNSYPTDRIAQAAAREAILDTEYTQKIVYQIIAAREYAAAAMHQMGLTVIPSDTNFIFVKADADNAAWVKDALKKRGILVRHFDKERIRPYLRITVGTMQDMQKVVAALADILKKA